MRKTVYIAGPMSGLPELNFPAFNSAAKAWRDAGHRVENPADNGEDKTKPYTEYLRLGLLQLLCCDAIALLPNWEKSTGACMELIVAQTIQMDVFDALTMEPLAITRLKPMEAQDA